MAKERFWQMVDIGPDPYSNPGPALIPDMPEAEFQAAVITAAQERGWLAYHTHDSRRSPAGFPDLCLVHPKRGIIFAELKTAKGKVKGSQKKWLNAIEDAGGAAHLWRPADWERILEILGWDSRTLINPHTAH